MGRIRQFFRRLGNAIRPDRAEASLEREVASHLVLLEDEYRRRGLSDDEARGAARRALGGLDRTKELHRDARSFIWVDEVRRDLRYAARRLAGNPGFALTVVLTVGLAVGGIGAVFSLINVVLLAPLPYGNPGDLVVIWERQPDAGTSHNEVAPVNYDILTKNHQAFTSVAAVAGFSATLSGGGGPEQVTGRRVTHNFFDVLGITPALGRTFRPEEDRPGAPRVVVVSHGLWRERFGGDPGVVGRDIVLNKEPYSIIGVMPSGFQFLGANASLWTPAAFSSNELTRGANYLSIVGRLAPGTTVERAQLYLDHLAARLATVLPPASEGFRLNVVSLHDEVAGDARRPLVVLLAAVGFVMLIACANVAGLLVARGATRQHEIALRRSLGATRSRIVRQLLIESLVLSVLALLAGVVLARWALVFLAQLVPPEMLLFAQPALDGRTLVVTSLVALSTAILFGLVPALYVTRVDLSAALKSGGRGLWVPNAGRRVLVVAEVAMTLVLLVVAGLLIQTLYQLRYADLGFQPAQVMSLRTALPSDAYPTHQKRVAFYDDVIERVSHLPGVVAVGYSTSVPLAWKGATTDFVIEGRAPRPGARYQANLRQVSAAYLQTIGVPLLEGRHIAESDRAGAQPVVVINQAMARTYWPGEHVIGRRFKPTDQAGSPWLTVVGVIGDVRQMGLDLPSKPEMYVPYRQFDLQAWFAPRDLVVRSTGDPTQLVPGIIREVHAVDPTLPVTHIVPLDDLLDREVASRRIGTIVIVAFAAVAVALAVVGIYGLISYFVAQHTAEIGVRVALGARPGDILALVAGRGVVSTAVGIAIGAVGALATTRVVSSLLYGISAFDPTTLLLASTLLLAVASVASYVPARRAMKLDALAALRQQ